MINPKTPYYYLSSWKLRFDASVIVKIWYKDS